MGQFEKDLGRLLLKLKEGEGVLIGETTVYASKVKGSSRMRLCVEAPKSVKISRVYRDPEVAIK